MNEAQKILQMIEGVDPNDTAALDEIDARVWCYVHEKEYSHHSRSTVAYKVDNDFYGSRAKVLKEYTRSRDALKAIRPEGWLYQGCFYNPATNVSGCNFSNPSRTSCVTGEVMGQNEELAELHAIIQAIAYERGEK